MKERKTRSDYELVERTMSGGRSRQEAVYRGPLYRRPDRSGRRHAFAQLACAAVWWAFALVWMRTAGGSGRCMYVLLPLSLGVFPGAYWLMGACAMLTAPEPMTERRVDTGPRRALHSAAGCTVFTSAALIGLVVYLSRSGWQELHSPALLAGALLTSVSGFLAARRSLSTLVREEPAGGPPPERPE